MANGKVHVLPTSDLPAPCPECWPYGGNFRMLPNDSMGRCDCRRGVVLKRRDLERKGQVAPQDPVISERAAKSTVQAMTAIGDSFPRAEEAKTLIAAEVMAICGSVAQARWLGMRMVHLYDVWPGVAEMRRVYCRNYHPLDGIQPASLVSTVFPEGIPAESPQGECRPVALPPGHHVSAAPKLEQAIDQLAAAKSMPAGAIEPSRPGQKVVDIRAERVKEESRTVAAQEELGLSG